VPSLVVKMLPSAIAFNARFLSVLTRQIQI